MNRKILANKAIKQAPDKANCRAYLNIIQKALAKNALNLINASVTTPKSYKNLEDVIRFLRKRYLCCHQNRIFIPRQPFY